MSVKISSNAFANVSILDSVAGPLGQGGNLPPEPRTGVVNMPRLPGPQEAREDFQRNNAIAGNGGPGVFSLIGAKVSSVFGNLFKRIRKVFQRVNITLPESVRVQMPRQLGTVDLPGPLLKTMIDKTPKAERQAAFDHLAETLSRRLARGADLLDRVMQPGVDPANLEAPTVQDVSDILLFIQARSWQTGNGYEEGSLSIEDPNGQLLDYFDRCTEVYARSSTHLNEMQGVQVNGHLNTHRGIDIPQGVNGLANTHRTMLFGGIPARTDDAGRQISAQRLFIKTETFGIRFSTVSTDAISEGAGRFMHHRPARMSDVPESLGHMGSLLQSLFYAPIASRKERIPEPVKDAYKDLLETPQIKNNPQLTAVMTAHDPLSKSGGIRIMDENIRAFTDHNVPDERMTAALEKFYMALSEMKDRSHVDVRIGNEVILDRTELFPRTA